MIVLLNIFTGRGYHVLTSGPEAKPVADPHVVNIQVSVGSIVGIICIV